jgi:hypothetical protein
MGLIVAEALVRPLLDVPVSRSTGVSMRGGRQSFQIRVDRDKKSDVESCSCLFGNLQKCGVGCRKWGMASIHVTVI